MVISHVEAVGRQQQPAIQPCTNSTVNFLGNPRGFEDVRLQSST